MNSSPKKNGHLFANPDEVVSVGDVPIRRADIGAYARVRQRAAHDSIAYWDAIARSCAWFKPWKKVLTWKLPNARWFEGGTTNIAYNALDVHIERGLGNTAAIIWEGESGSVRTYTYQQLLNEVNKCARALMKLGVGKGDVVAVYMGLTPEAAITMLACARIGAVHTVVFGGFSSEALRSRILDARVKVVVCGDGVQRRGEIINLKKSVDDAVRGVATVAHVVVVQHAASPVSMKKVRDVWWHDVVVDATPLAAATLNAEDPLFYLYTSGSTGAPKGLVHTVGGYMVYAKSSFSQVFQTTARDVYWCTADVGWITGHTYVVYGPLLNGATIFMYEGAISYPSWDRVWSMIDKHGITILYTAPTAIRSFIRAGDEHVTKHRLTSLRLLGSVGEPINPDVWRWFYRVVGKGRCPIVDTWWQTETGGILIAPIPSQVPLKPGSATLPLPGILAEVVRPDGVPCKPLERGLLVIQKPWPGMARTILGDHKRYVSTYWKTVPGSYFTGDSAFRDRDGYIWILGRVDDVVNVSGHRLGTAEIEGALVSHPAIAEAAVVAKPHDIKGSALVAYVVVKQQFRKRVSIDAWKKHVGQKIGTIAIPDELYIVDALPKTRSGKIMRRILRERAQGREPSGDISTLDQ